MEIYRFHGHYPDLNRSCGLRSISSLVAACDIQEAIAAIEEKVTGIKIDGINHVGELLESVMAKQKRAE